MLFFGLAKDPTRDLFALSLSVRNEAGKIVAHCGEWTADTPWAALATALTEAQTINAAGVAIFTNHRPTLLSLSRCETPAPDKIEKIWQNPAKGSGEKGKYLNVEFGGDPNHWATLRLLTTYCTKKGWAIHFRQSLPKTEELLST